MIAIAPDGPPADEADVSRHDDVEDSGAASIDPFDDAIADVLAVLDHDDELIVVDARGVATPPPLSQPKSALDPAADSTQDVADHDPGQAPGHHDLGPRQPMDDTRVRWFLTATSRSQAWSINLGLRHARGRILAVVRDPAGAAAVAEQHAMLASRNALVVEVRVPSANDARPDVVGLVGWRDAALGRVGFLDVDTIRPWADWHARAAAAIVPRAHVQVDVAIKGLLASPSRGGRRAGDIGLGVGSAVGGEHRVSMVDRGRVGFPPRREPVAITLASIPQRRRHLEHVVSTLLPQTDLLAVHLNHYPDTPGVLDHPRIVVSHSHELGDLRDNGKAAFSDVVPDGYHLMVDDDIDYPDDYVDGLIAKVEQYDRRAVVGYHGAVLELPVSSYFASRSKVLHFGTELGEDRRVHVLGTGTVAMHTDTLRLGLDDLPTTGMVDIWLAVAATRRAIPLVAVARPTRHLRELPRVGPTLYQEYRDDDQAHYEALRTLDLPVLD
ncbi:hypothetical protein [Salsipaludibacter albus]|uniref:hypothetical protein n=1 Tax=Salsipaludibacter albus TaxID=2849650 RepID=UPI001EE4BFC5|nr:hypothetical protein [Salsipaludibacter albus]MBY5163289.1 hypothetical protein [Salsipaludibacter albus]